MLELKAIIENGEVNIIIYKGLKTIATARIAETYAKEKAYKTKEAAILSDLLIYNSGRTNHDHYRYPYRFPP